jgi:uncharacterized protein (DUF1778 family)
MVAKPKKKEKAKRETPLQIRLTEEEKRVFAEAAGRAHETVSNWIRQAAWHAATSKHPLE